MILRHTACVILTVLSFLGGMDALYISLNTERAVLNTQAQCWTPLIENAGGDSFLTRDEYASFVEQYTEYAQGDDGDGSGDGSGDSDGSGGHSHEQYDGVIVNNFNGFVDPYAQIFNNTFDDLIDYCKTIKLCGDDYDQNAIPIFDLGSTIKPDIMEKTYFFVVCDKTVQRINGVYDTFGRDEPFQVDIEYQFYSAVNMTNVADLMIYRWDKFLRGLELDNVSHLVGYDTTSVEVTGTCDIEDAGVDRVEDTDEEIKCYNVKLSMEAKTDKNNPSSNEQVADDVEKSIRRVIEDDVTVLSFGCDEDEDKGCRIALYIAAIEETPTTPTTPEDDDRPRGSGEKSYLPLYISLGSAGLVGIIIGAFATKKFKSSPRRYAQVEFPIQVPEDDEEIMIEDEKTDFDNNIVSNT